MECVENGFMPPCKQLDELAKKREKGACVSRGWRAPTVYLHCLIGEKDRTNRGVETKIRI